MRDPIFAVQESSLALVSRSLGFQLDTIDFGFGSHEIRVRLLTGDWNAFRLVAAGHGCQSSLFRVALIISSSGEVWVIIHPQYQRQGSPPFTANLMPL